MVELFVAGVVAWVVLWLWILSDTGIGPPPAGTA